MERKEKCFISDTIKQDKIGGVVAWLGLLEGAEVTGVEWDRAIMARFDVALLRLSM